MTKERNNEETPVAAELRKLRTLARLVVDLDRSADHFEEDYAAAKHIARDVIDNRVLGRGNHHQMAKARRISAEKRKAKALTHNEPVIKRIRVLRAEGRGPKAIADALNTEGFSTGAGRPFTPQSILHVESLFNDR